MFKVLTIATSTRTVLHTRRYQDLAGVYPMEATCPFPSPSTLELHQYSSVVASEDADRLKIG